MNDLEFKKYIDSFEEINNFTLFYRMLKKNLKTKNNLIYLYNKGYYSADLIDDMLAMKVNLNPIDEILKLFHREDMANVLVKRIRKHFNTKQIIRLYNLKYESLSYRQNIFLKKMFNLELYKTKDTEVDLFIGSGVRIFVLSSKEIYVTNKNSDRLENAYVAIDLPSDYLNNELVLSPNDYCILDSVSNAVKLFKDKKIV